MAAPRTNTIIQQLCRVALAHGGAGMTDGQLLERFIVQKEEAAFEALLRRHGPMVLGVCRRILRNHHDADDAFQATFLILARKAASVRPREMVANWLHGVAYRTALKARSLRAKTRARERQVTELPEAATMRHDDWHDLQPLLDQELQRLPESYRLPILLCDLEGKSIKEATRQLGWPQGTLAGRLARARKLLAKRLTQRGVALSGGALAAVLTSQVSASLPPLLAVSTARAAGAFAAGQSAAAGLLSVQVTALTEGVLKTMFLMRLKTMLALLIVLGTVACGGGLLTHYTAAAQPIKAVEEDKKSEKRKEDGKALQSLDEKLLHGEWVGNIAGAEIRFFFGPNHSIQSWVKGTTTTHAIKPPNQGAYSVDWNKTPHHLDVNWKTLPVVYSTIFAFAADGELCLELAGTHRGPGFVRPTEFLRPLILTRVEKFPPGSPEEEAQANTDLDLGLEHQRRGNYAQAHYYYEVVRRRYPDTKFAKRARELLVELNKHRIRRADGSEVWLSLDPEPSVPQSPPTEQASNSDTETGQEVAKLREQIKALERRLALEAKGKTEVDDKKPSQNHPDGLRETLAAPKASLEVDAKVSDRIWDIKIVGAKTAITNAIVRSKLQLHAGEYLDEQLLRAVEQRLATYKAVVTVQDAPRVSWKSILVTVREP